MKWLTVELSVCTLC